MTDEQLATVPVSADEMRKGQPLLAALDVRSGPARFQFAKLSRRGRASQGLACSISQHLQPTFRRSPDSNVSPERSLISSQQLLTRGLY
jgi:hypothetical protein